QLTGLPERAQLAYRDAPPGSARHLPGLVGGGACVALARGLHAVVGPSGLSAATPVAGAHHRTAAAARRRQAGAQTAAAPAARRQAAERRKADRGPAAAAGTAAAAGEKDPAAGATDRQPAGRGQERGPTADPTVERPRQPRRPADRETRQSETRRRV